MIPSVSTGRSEAIPYLRRAKALLKETERRQARQHLAVYAGLHMPAEIEREDLLGMEKLPMAARYVPAEHHRLIIEKLEAVERGYVMEGGKRVPFKRLMIFSAPGTAKSTYASVLFPAWYLGRNPRHCVIQGSYNDSLASRFGRRARNTFASETHHRIFGVGLAKDSKAAGEWETELGGEYFSFGVNVGVTGRRANGAILDDLIKGRKEADSKTVRDSTWETYKADVRTRLFPEAWIVFICTRWHEDDPSGRILPPEAMGKSGWFTALDGERWYVISLAAVIETPEEKKADPLGRALGEHIWPEWFSKDHFEQERRTQGQRNWSALFQQKPRPDEGAILKREYWRKWPSDKAPKCHYVVLCYDTAFEEGEDDDYSAMTAWGMFEYEEAPPPEGATVPKERWRRPFVGKRMGAILISAWEDKVEFPELRRLVLEHERKFKPDRVLVEKRSSGHSLIQELRRTGVHVVPLKADISKLARAHSASAVLEDGCVWYMDRRWAEHVIDRCAAATFVKGSPGNDTADTCVHAWTWLRKTFHLATRSDRSDEDEDEEDVAEEDGPRHRLFG